MATRNDPRSSSRRDETAHHPSRDSLYTLFMQAPALICVLRGRNHIIDLVNPPYQHLFGDRELVGKPVREALPELQGQRCFEQLDRVYTSGEPYFRKEARVLLDRAGSGKLDERFFNFIDQPLFENGQIAGIATFGFEVTDEVLARRRADEDMEAARERVRRSEEMFRLLVESVEDYAIYMLDAEGRIVTWNAGAERKQLLMLEPPAAGRCRAVLPRCE